MLTGPQSPSHINIRSWSSGTLWDGKTSSKDPPPLQIAQNSTKQVWKILLKPSRKAKKNRPWNMDKVRQSRLEPRSTKGPKMSQSRLSHKSSGCPTAIKTMSVDTQGICICVPLRTFKIVASPILRSLAGALVEPLKQRCQCQLPNQPPALLRRSSDGKRRAARLQGSRCCRCCGCRRRHRRK